MTEITLSGWMVKGVNAEVYAYANGRQVIAHEVVLTRVEDGDELTIRNWPGAPPTPGTEASVTVALNQAEPHTFASERTGS